MNKSEFDNFKVGDYIRSKRASLTNDNAFIITDARFRSFSGELLLETLGVFNKKYRTFVLSEESYNIVKITLEEILELKMKQNVIYDEIISNLIKENK